MSIIIKNKQINWNIKAFFVFSLLIIFCVLVGKGWYWATDGFRVDRIETEEPWGHERPLSEEAESALRQRFYYLGRGRQCFAFVSEDGQYVLKFPRMDRYKNRENGERKKKAYFKSLEIAYDELKEESALIGMFNCSKKRIKIELVDRIGRIVHLPLEKTKFILQRKMKLFKDVFREDNAEWIVDCLLKLIVKISRMDILSKDGGFMENFAFDDKRAYQIDVGSYYRKEGAFNKAIHASIENLRVFLRDTDPELLTMIDNKLACIYEP